MNLDPSEILYLTPEDWGGSFPAVYTPQQKGLAIDLAIKRAFGGASGKYDPFDMQFSIDGCAFHEVKSSTTKWLKISPGEIEHADDALLKGQDTLFWAIDQLEARDEYRIFAIAKYSKIKPFIFKSNYDLCWVKRGEEWTQELGFTISKYTVRDNGEL